MPDGLGSCCLQRIEALVRLKLTFTGNVNFPPAFVEYFCADVKKRWSLLVVPSRQSGPNLRESAPSIRLDQLVSIWPRFRVPPRRQLNLIRLINPAFKNIGIIVTEQSETHLQALKKVANDSQLTINEFITSSTNVRYQIADVSKSSDIILAIADTKIYNAASLPQILLTSYRYGTPILGFSKGFIKAGAIAGTVSSLEQLTSHLAESILDFNNPHSLNTNNVIYPKYFDVITNRNVAKSLNLHFSSDNELKQQLITYESTQ